MFDSVSVGFLPFHRWQRLFEFSVPRSIFVYLGYFYFLMNNLIKGVLYFCRFFAEHPPLPPIWKTWDPTDCISCSSSDFGFQLYLLI